MAPGARTPILVGMGESTYRLRAVRTASRELKCAPARVQWDPERDLQLRPLAHRSLQLGLAGEAAERYADEWTVGITDVTPLAHAVHAHVKDGDLEAARRLLPDERPYPAGDRLLAPLRG
ncbi:hypothetical protein GCM10010371_47210 [Streptomyces subrutilus]|uniref:DUF4291 family protein n=2 Tax=Streptomyces subrutilus TaxID=36818 RepID=A0A918R4U7_9ACTN|nr:hypothetical protein GCM10010371_47210 [Streptomyces subrutilus]